MPIVCLQAGGSWPCCHASMTLTALARDSILGVGELERSLRSLRSFRLSLCSCMAEPCVFMVTVRRLRPAAVVWANRGGVAGLCNARAQATGVLGQHMGPRHEFASDCGRGG